MRKLPVPDRFEWNNGKAAGGIERRALAEFGDWLLPEPRYTIALTMWQLTTRHKRMVVGELTA